MNSTSSAILSLSTENLTSAASILSTKNALSLAFSSTNTTKMTSAMEKVTSLPNIFISMNLISTSSMLIALKTTKFGHTQLSKSTLPQTSESLHISKLATKPKNTAKWVSIQTVPKFILSKSLMESTYTASSSSILLASKASIHAASEASVSASIKFATFTFQTISVTLLKTSLKETTATVKSMSLQFTLEATSLQFPFIFVTSTSIITPGSHKSTLVSIQGVNSVSKTLVASVHQTSKTSETAAKITTKFLTPVPTFPLLNFTPLKLTSKQMSVTNSKSSLFIFTNAISLGLQGQNSKPLNSTKISSFTVEPTAHHSLKSLKSIKLESGITSIIASSSINKVSSNPKSKFQSANVVTTEKEVISLLIPDLASIPFFLVETSSKFSKLSMKSTVRTLAHSFPYKFTSTASSKRMTSTQGSNIKSTTSKIIQVSGIQYSVATLKTIHSKTQTYRPSKSSTMLPISHAASVISLNSKRVSNFVNTPITVKHTSEVNLHSEFSKQIMSASKIVSFRSNLTTQSGLSMQMKTTYSETLLNSAQTNHLSKVTTHKLIPTVTFNFNTITVKNSNSISLESLNQLSSTNLLTTKNEIWSILISDRASFPFFLVETSSRNNFHSQIKSVPQSNKSSKVIQTKLSVITLALSNTNESIHLNLSATTQIHNTNYNVQSDGSYENSATSIQTNIQRNTLLPYSAILPSIGIKIYTTSKVEVSSKSAILHSKSKNRGNATSFKLSPVSTSSSKRFATFSKPNTILSNIQNIASNSRKVTSKRLKSKTSMHFISNGISSENEINTIITTANDRFKTKSILESKIGPTNKANIVSKVKTKPLATEMSSISSLNTNSYKSIKSHNLLSEHVTIRGNTKSKSNISNSKESQINSIRSHSISNLDGNETRSRNKPSIIPKLTNIIQSTLSRNSMNTNNEIKLQNTYAESRQNFILSTKGPVLKTDRVLTTDIDNIFGVTIAYNSNSIFDTVEIDFNELIGNKSQSLTSWTKSSSTRLHESSAIPKIFDVTYDMRPSLQTILFDVSALNFVKLESNTLKNTIGQMTKSKFSRDTTLNTNQSFVDLKTQDNKFSSITEVPNFQSYRKSPKVTNAKNSNPRTKYITHTLTKFNGFNVIIYSDKVEKSKMLRSSHFSTSGIELKAKSPGNRSISKLDNLQNHSDIFNFESMNTKFYTTQNHLDQSLLPQFLFEAITEENSQNTTSKSDSYTHLKSANSIDKTVSKNVKSLKVSNLIDKTYSKSSESQNFQSNRDAYEHFSTDRNISKERLNGNLVHGYSLEIISNHTNSHFGDAVNSKTTSSSNAD